MSNDNRNMLNVAISHLTAIADGSAAQHGSERARASLALDALRAIVDRPAPTPTPAPGLDLDAVDQDFRAAMEGPPGNRSAIKFYHETWPALIAEVRALRRHYDAAGPDRNLLALLDLYHEREQAALAKLAEAKRLGLIAARVVLDDDTDLPAIAAALEAL